VAESPRLSSRAKWVALAVVALLGSMVVLAAAEGLVRLRQWSKYGTTASYEGLYRVDEKIKLRVLVPGAKIGNITINASGFRGPAIEMPKPPGRIRLAFLGASTTFCAEVSGDDAVWPSLVVEQLRARFPQAQFDFVNGGVPGYTVRSSTLNLQHLVDPLDPDLVVIYHATNDLSGEVNQLAVEQGLTAADRNRQNWMARHFLLWELVEKNLKVMGAQRGAESDAHRVVLDKARIGTGFDKDLRELMELAGRDNRRVAVATFSTQLRAEQTTEEKKRAAVSALVYMPNMSLDSLLFGYAKYNDIIRTVAGDRGALLIEGENEIPGDAAHFVDTVHFNDAGSRKMAERVSAALANDPAFIRLVESRRRH
jgi:lysophospholipase L1-like esterase